MRSVGVLRNPGAVYLDRPRRFVAEARALVDSLSAAEGMQLVALALGMAATSTAASRVASVKAFGRRAYAVGARLKRRLDEQGLSGLLDQIPTSFEEVKRAVLGEAGRRVRALRALPPDQRREELTRALIAGATALAVAGGSDLEGGLPDMDLLLGVGVHRNPFSHGILLPLTVETCVRFALAVAVLLQDRLPEEHDPLWDRLVALFDQVCDGAIVGVWLGAAAHLLKDAGLPGSGVKPYAMLPIHLTNEGHQALFAANGASCAVLGGFGVGARPDRRWPASG